MKWGGVMENFREKNYYRKEIIKMVEEIENLRFLKAIYISLREFLSETERKEEKPE